MIALMHHSCCRSCCVSPEGVERDLVEPDAREALDLEAVLGGAALLEALERLAVAGGGGEKLAVAGDLDVVLLHVLALCGRRALGALEVCLQLDQLGGADRRGRGLQLRGPGLLDALLGVAQRVLRRALARHRTRKLLLGEVLAPLAQVTDLLESKLEWSGTAHDPVNDRAGEI
jgi:hypothetical protein